MPYKYIGRTHDFKGKSLWEIIGNLKNFGVGRLVTRNVFSERYPEPTYFKILKVETLPEPKNKSLDNLRKVRVLVEKTFRGKPYYKPLYIESTSYKTDYKLIPKDEEEEFCKFKQPLKCNEKILPRTMVMPPLLKELIIQEMKAKGETIKEPLMEIEYNKNSKKMGYRIAEEGEKPSVEFKIGLGKPVAPSLYKGIEL